MKFLKNKQLPSFSFKNACSPKESLEETSPKLEEEIKALLERELQVDPYYASLMTQKKAAEIQRKKELDGIEKIMSQYVGSIVEPEIRKNFEQAYQIYNVDIYYQELRNKRFDIIMSHVKQRHPEVNIANAYATNFRKENYKRARGNLAELLRNNAALKL